MRFTFEQIKIICQCCIFFYFIYWTFITFQEHPQRKYGTASVKRQKKTLHTKRIAQFAQKKKRKENVYTEPAEGTLSFYTSKSAENMDLYESTAHKLECLHIFHVVFHIPEESQQDNKPIIDNNGVTVALKHKISFLTVSLIIFLHSEFFVDGKGCHTVIHCHGV